MTASTRTPSTTAARRLRADQARQVADVLRRHVLHASRPDALLPSEAELQREFGVSRNTVRAALELLRAEGLVERLPGVGTVVAGRKLVHGVETLRGLAETLHEHGPVHNEVRARGLVDPPSAVAARLGLRPGERVVYVERLRHVAGEPLSLDQTYLVEDLGTPLLDADLSGSDIFVLLEGLAGQRLGGAEITVEAVAADSHTAAVLDTARGAALLMVERLTSLADGRPVDLEFIRFRGDRLTLRGTTARAPEPARETPARRPHLEEQIA